MRSEAEFKAEIQKRIDFVRDVIASAGADGVVFGNSGGKDSALVGVLCKMACENTLGLIMPCGSNQNYGSDKADAEAVARQFGIDTRVVELTEAKNELIQSVGAGLTQSAEANIAPRLRMTVLYAVAASENRLVAGTGNRSERYMGYFTKWGDGAFDFNPIADLTVTEVYAFLRFLKAPDCIIDKAPSAGLFDGQTDEGEMGVTYQSIDAFLQGETISDHDKAVIERYHKNSGHKRKPPVVFE